MKKLFFIVITLMTSSVYAQDPTTINTNNTTTYEGINTSTSTNFNTNVNTNTNINESTNINTNTNTNTSTNTNTNFNTNVSTNLNVNESTINSVSTSNNVNTNNNFSESVSNNTNTNLNQNTSLINSNSNNVNTNTNFNENVSRNESVSVNETSLNQTSASTSTNVNQNTNVSENTNNNFNENVSRNESIQRIQQEIDSPPPSAIAPSIGSSYSQDMCTAGISGAVQTQIFGLSTGRSITDENCERIKLSKTLYDMGMRVAAVSLMCQDERVWVAMKMAGTPCPYEGRIGSEALASWEDNKEEVPGYNERRDRDRISTPNRPRSR